MDSYGGLLGNEYSGWLVMTAQDVTEGVIVLGIDFITYSPDDNERTRGWTEAKTSMKKGKKVKLDEDKTKGDEEGKEGKNDKDGDGGRNLRSQLGFDEDTVGIRRLLPETFRFEYDVDGKRTTLERDQFEAALKKPGSNFDVLTV